MQNKNKTDITEDLTQGCHDIKIDFDASVNKLAVDNNVQVKDFVITCNKVDSVSQCEVSLLEQGNKKEVPVTLYCDKCIQDDDFDLVQNHPVTVSVCREFLPDCKNEVFYSVCETPWCDHKNENLHEKVKDEVFDCVCETLVDGHENDDLQEYVENDFVENECDCDLQVNEMKECVCERVSVGVKQCVCEVFTLDYIGIDTVVKTIDLKNINVLQNERVVIEDKLLNSDSTCMQQICLLQVVEAADAHRDSILDLQLQQICNYRRYFG